MRSFTSSTSTSHVAARKRCEVNRRGETGAADRGGDLPGPATYDPADMNKCAQNSEEAPSFTMRNWTPYLDLPKRPPPKKFEKGMPPVDPGIGPKYDVGAKAGGSLPNKADPPSFSFGKDERFWDEDP